MLGLPYACYSVMPLDITIHLIYTCCFCLLIFLTIYILYVYAAGTILRRTEELLMSKQQFEIEIGSGNLRGACGFGKREDYTYPVPKEAITVALKGRDQSPNTFNIGNGNGKVELHWKRGDEEARVHAWVNGSAGAYNEVTWTVVAVLIV